LPATFYVAYSDVSSPGPTLQVRGGPPEAVPAPQLRLLYTLSNSDAVRLDVTFRAISPSGRINVSLEASFSGRLTDDGLLIDGRPSLFLLGPSLLANASRLNLTLTFWFNASLTSTYRASVELPKRGGAYSAIAVEASYGGGRLGSGMLAYYEPLSGLLLELVGTVKGDPVLARLGIVSYSGLLYLSDRSSNLGLSPAAVPPSLYVAEIALFLAAGCFGLFLLWRLARYRDRAAPS
jgi:hypothetical protein